MKKAFNIRFTGTSGIRKVVYRLGSDHPVFNEDNRSIISVEDLAMAIVDELEQPKHLQLLIKHI